MASVYRKSKELPFLPLILKFSGFAWDISSDGMKQLSDVDEDGDSIFGNAHVFYRDALKAGPQLDSLTIDFLHYLQQVLGEFEAQQPSDEISLTSWSNAMLGTASTNAMMGPALLRDNPDLLPSVFLVERGFFLFVNQVPRMFARNLYQARDSVLAAFTRYFSDERNREGSKPLVWDREAQLRVKGLTSKDIASYSFGAYTVSISAVYVKYTILISPSQGVREFYFSHVILIF
jgi:hypothetical protein